MSVTFDRLTKYVPAFSIQDRGVIIGCSMCVCVRECVYACVLFTPCSSLVPDSANDCSVFVVEMSDGKAASVSKNSLLIISLYIRFL